MRFTLTEKYELEDEIARLNSRCRRLEKEIGRQKVKASVFCRDTLDVFRILEIPMKDIEVLYEQVRCRNERHD